MEHGRSKTSSNDSVRLELKEAEELEMLFNFEGPAFKKNRVKVAYLSP